MTPAPRLTTPNKGRFRVAVLILGVLLLLVLVDSILSVPPTATGNFPSARAMLRAYYAAIDRRDYGAAYAMWAAPSGAYQAFAEGFEDTAGVTAYIGEFQAGGISSQAELRATAALMVGRVPVVVVAKRLSGQFASFYGCFYVRDTGRQGPTWVIDTAMILDYHTPLPDAPTIDRLLAINCFGDYSEVS